MTGLPQIPEDQQVSSTNIFTKLLTSPRAAFKFIHTHRFEKHLLLLLAFSGIVRAFDRASMKNLGDNLSLWGVIGFCAVLGGLFGVVTNVIYSTLISRTGKWLNGMADTRSILRVLSYAMFPSIVGLLFFVPRIAVYGNQLFISNGDIYSAGWLGNILLSLSLLAEFTLSMWTIILCVIGVSEVQNFSIGKAIANILLPVFVCAAVLLALFFVIDLF